MPKDASHLRPPPLAKRRYREHEDSLRGRGIGEVFTYIYQANVWGSDVSPSGVGSEDSTTQLLQKAIPGLLRDLGVTVFLDIPCGDFGWLSQATLDGVEYIGADIVEELIRRNTGRVGNAESRRSFLQRDLTTDPLPRADLVLCRDCLVHLSYADIFRAFANLRRSGSEYLLATTFTEIGANSDITTGDWRPLNLLHSPFCLPKPITLIMEGCNEEGGAYADKALALWKISDLPAQPQGCGNKCQ